MKENIKAKFQHAGRTFRIYLHPEMEKNKSGQMEPTDTISKKIWNDKTFYELIKIQEMLTHIKDDTVVFDCGANIGNHTVFWGSRCKEVHAFEAFPQSFELLEKNMAVNHIQGKAYKVLLGNNPGRYKVVTTKISRGATHFVPDPDGPFESVRLDDIVDPAVKPGFIKIDVEGDELELLKGAKRILSESHPILWIEIHFFYHNDLDAQVLNELKQYGYAEGVDVFLSRRRKK